MGNNRTSIEQLKKVNKENSIEQLKKTNELSVKERDYMIRTAMRRLGITDEWSGTVKKAANYLDGVRFWDLVDIAQSKRKPANYFVFVANKELAMNATNR